MITRQSKSIHSVIIVLGKRLVCNQLTLEGLSRVDYLADYLQRFDLAQTALIFCGGVTSGQTDAEAKAMYTRFEQLKIDAKPALVMLEPDSTNTVENVENAALKMINSNRFNLNECLDVFFVSNDYHLERIFQIQTLMDEQGLLKVLRDRCLKAGLSLKISPDLFAHGLVPYPHKNDAGIRFLAIDELTVYRVYLEGVVQGAFNRSLAEVRAEPYCIAKLALEKLAQSLECKHDLALVNELSNIVESTTEQCPVETVRTQLARFHQILTGLNRKYDPESPQ